MLHVVILINSYTTFNKKENIKKKKKVPHKNKLAAVK